MYIYIFTYINICIYIYIYICIDIYIYRLILKPTPNITKIHTKNPLLLNTIFNTKKC